MATIKSASEIANKWQTVTPQRSGDYETGVKNPRKSWATQTEAAASNYKEGVTKAAASGSFAKGVKKAGDTKWQKGATEKGVNRWASGVASAGDNYAKGFEPYRAAIESVQLPQRYAKRDPRNLQRVTAVVNATSAAKESQLKSS